MWLVVSDERCRPQGFGKWVWIAKLGESTAHPPLLCEQLTCGGGKARAVDAVVAEDFLLASGHGVIIGKSDDFKAGGDAFLEQQAGAGFAKAAVDTVLFDGDHAAGLGGGLPHRGLVEGFEGVHTQNPALQTLLGQQFGRFKGRCHRFTAGQKA